MKSPNQIEMDAYRTEIRALMLQLLPSETEVFNRIFPAGVDAMDRDTIRPAIELCQRTIMRRQERVGDAPVPAPVPPPEPITMAVPIEPNADDIRAITDAIVAVPYNCEGSHPVGGWTELGRAAWDAILRRYNAERVDG